MVKFAYVLGPYLLYVWHRRTVGLEILHAWYDLPGLPGGIPGTTAGYTLDLAKYIASKSKKPGTTYTTVPDMIPVPEGKYQVPR